MSYSFLSQSIRAQDIVFWGDLRRWNNSFSDLSSYGHDITVRSNVFPGGGGYQFSDANGYMRLDASDDLWLSNFTLMVMAEFGRIERAAANPGFLLTKMDGGGTIEWQWGIDDTPQLFFVDTGAAATRTLACTYLGKRVLAITVTDGGTPIGYTDGVLEGNYSGIVDIDTGAPDFYIYLGNNDGPTRSMYNPMQAALIWNRVLTAAEISESFGELMALAGGEH